MRNEIIKAPEFPIPYLVSLTFCRKNGRRILPEKIHSSVPSCNFKWVDLVTFSTVKSSPFLEKKNIIFIVIFCRKKKMFLAHILFATLICAAVNLAASEDVGNVNDFLADLIKSNFDIYALLHFICRYGNTRH